MFSRSITFNAKFDLIGRSPFSNDLRIIVPNAKIPREPEWKHELAQRGYMPHVMTDTAASAIHDRYECYRPLDRLVPELEIELDFEVVRTARRTVEGEDPFGV